MSVLVKERRQRRRPENEKVKIFSSGKNDIQQAVGRSVVIPLVLFTAHSRSRFRRVFLLFLFHPTFHSSFSSPRVNQTCSICDRFHGDSAAREPFPDESILVTLSFPSGGSVRFGPASHEKEREREILGKPCFYSDALIYDTFDRFCHSAASRRPSGLSPLGAYLPSDVVSHSRYLRLVSSSALRATYATYIVTNCNDHAELVEERKRGNKRERDGNDFLSLSVDASLIKSKKRRDRSTNASATSTAPAPTFPGRKTVERAP